jgi:hypothetical protein
LVLLAWFLMAPPARAAEPPLEPVSLPPGETPLAELGAYRVGWQSYGSKPVAMPGSWIGHFDPQTGISYQPWGRMLGRQAIFMHSPWRVPPGKTWVDYPVRLPATGPVRLSLGITMSPEAAAPGKSDGVTFSCYLIDGDREQELFRRHHDKAEWIDYQFDLSPHVGKAVVVRLQVEPGPKNNASFDFSYFGDAKITVGSGKPAGDNTLADIMASRAYRAIADRSLTTLRNVSDRGVTPSNILPCTNRLEGPAGMVQEGATGVSPVPGQSTGKMPVAPHDTGKMPVAPHDTGKMPVAPHDTGKMPVAPRDTGKMPVAPHDTGKMPVAPAWQFVYEGDDCRLTYTYRPTTGTLDDFQVQLDGGRPFQPAVGGGATVLVRQGDKSEEIFARGGRAISVKPHGDSLDVAWEYPIGDKPVRIDWTFRIRGKALVVSARCDDPVVSRFTLGELGPVPLRRLIDVPYLAGPVCYSKTPGAFVCRWLDWTVSHASQCPQGAASYEPKTDGSRNPLLETGYVAVSPDVGEVLPNLPHPPSPYLAVLGPRIMLDIWGHHKGTYQGDAENLRELKDNGVDHVAIIQHCWQRYGYDVKLPDHLPANPQFGGDEGMIAFGRAANECGYVWSVHENYIDLYPDAPSYDPSARVLLADGSPAKAWYNAGTRVQSFGLKCNRALEFAKQNAPEIHRRYGTTAGYLDVHTCVPPWHELDHQADQPMAAMALAKVTNDTALFQFMRDTHGGPMFGEGANHFYWAGRCDGVEAQVAGGEEHRPLLDFDLLKVHPQMVNHGMGYYERWFRGGYGMRWGYDSGTIEQADKYRAQELAYGHAGFVGNLATDNIDWVVREHHLMHPVQRLYGTACPTEIRYEVAGRLVTASAALAADDTSRQRIRYEPVGDCPNVRWSSRNEAPKMGLSPSHQSGLTLWVNWRAEPWAVEGHLLPQWGFLALGPDTRVATALHDGRVADYAECPEYVFADARTHCRPASHHAVKDIRPRLASFKYLGGDRVELSYEWIVNDSLDDDYHCFVHGVTAISRRVRDISFQQDHSLPQPTHEWRKGMRIVDGPYPLAIPAKSASYDLLIGLYKGARVSLVGGQRTGDSVPIARITLRRQGERVVGIEARPLVPAADEKEDLADFTAHVNPPGTWIDFGPLATDGAAKIERQADRLVVFPYPRDTAFRMSLNLKALAPAADPARVQVHAQAAGTARDLGPAEFRWEHGRLVIPAGKAGVGRFLVTWK